MRAVFHAAYASPDLLEVRELPRPVPASNEVLARVHYASVHPDIWHTVHGIPYVLRLMGGGLRKPKPPIPGIDFAGEVVQVGENVTRFGIGDRVFGETVSMQWKNGGTYAEYVAVRQERIEHVPDNVTLQQAACVPTSGKIALQGLRDCLALKAGDRLLIIGAGGNVGCPAIQIAKSVGVHVTAVDQPSTLDMIRGLGADVVIDYTTTNVTRQSMKYDAIYDIACVFPYAAIKRILKSDGQWLVVGHDHYGKPGRKVFGSLPWVFGLMFRSVFDRKLRANRITSETPDRLKVLADMLAAGTLTPIVDRVFPITEVAKAIHYLESGVARGKILISTSS